MDRKHDDGLQWPDFPRSPQPICDLSSRVSEVNMGTASHSLYAVEANATYYYTTHRSYPTFMFLFCPTKYCTYFPLSGLIVTSTLSSAYITLRFELDDGNIKTVTEAFTVA